MYELNRLARFASSVLLLATPLALGLALGACGPSATTLGQVTLIRRDATQTFPANSDDDVQGTSACSEGRAARQWRIWPEL